MADPLERRLELLMLLRQSPPLTRAQIMDRTGAYGSDADAGRATFERDKRALRDLGVPIHTVIAEGDEGATRYTVDPDEYDLPELHLEPEEQLALKLATALVDLDVAWDDEAVRKLGGVGGHTAAPLAAMPTLDLLPDLHRAVAARATLSLRYRDRDRRLEPRGLIFRGGHWYLIADEDGTQKSFRVDRIEDRPEVGPGDEFAPSVGDLRSALTSDPMLIERDDEIVARVRISGPQAARAARLPGLRTVENVADDVIDVELTIVNRAAFLAWVLGLRERAEVLSPPELRAEVIDWVRQLVDVDEKAVLR